MFFNRQQLTCYTSFSKHLHNPTSPSDATQPAARRLRQFNLNTPNLTSPATGFTRTEKIDTYPPPCSPPSEAPEDDFFLFFSCSRCATCAGAGDGKCGMATPCARDCSPVMRATPERSGGCVSAVPSAKFIPFNNCVDGAPRTRPPGGRGMLRGRVMGVGVVNAAGACE